MPSQPISIKIHVDIFLLSTQMPSEEPLCFRVSLLKLLCAFLRRTYHMALPSLTIPDLFTSVFLNLKKKKVLTSPCKMPFQACLRQLEWRVSSTENLHTYTYKLNRDTLQFTVRSAFTGHALFLFLENDCRYRNMIAVQ